MYTIIYCVIHLINLLLGIKEYTVGWNTLLYYVLLTTLKTFETDLIKLTFHIPTKNMPTSFDTHGHFPNEFHCTLTVGNIDKSIIRMYRKYHIQVVSNTVQGPVVQKAISLTQD